MVEIDKSYRFRSSFNFVPLKYKVDRELRDYLMSEGFEINIHGLLHDGKLFLSRKLFSERAKKINFFINEWGCKGFYAPSTIKNSEWLHDLNIEFDASTFDTDPFEPQPKGVKRIFPFIVCNIEKTHSYVEIPYTIPQDSTLFLILKEKNIDIWKKKIDWLVENEGMVHIRTHPDYLNFNDKSKINEYPASLYIELLEYIVNKYKDQYWHVLPKEIAEFWRKNFLNKKL